jgi:hypothetical protein
MPNGEIHNRATDDHSPRLHFARQRLLVLLTWPLNRYRKIYDFEPPRAICR